MNTELLDTLKALSADPARAIELYSQLYQASFFVLVQTGSEQDLGSMLFLTYQTSDGVRELPVFTQQDFILTDLADDAISVELRGAVLWERLLDIIKPGECEAAVDPDRPHGIRLNREMVLGMCLKYGEKA
jgi:hypothetical protein